MYGFAPNLFAGECVYVRVSYRLLECRAAALSADSPAEFSEGLPELGGPEMRMSVKLTCSCEYTLSGSDPRCDPDMAREVTSLIASDHPTVTCRRGNTLCHELCQKRWP